MAAGIISIPVINNSPTIFIEIAIIAANKTVKIVLYLSGFIPSASANSKFTVAANNGFQIIFKIKRIKAPPIQINNKSFWLTAKMSPNSKPITSNLIEDKKSGEYRLSHHLDLKTGMYKGRQVLDPKE